MRYFVVNMLTLFSTTTSRHTPQHLSSTLRHYSSVNRSSNAATARGVITSVSHLRIWKTLAP